MFHTVKNSTVYCHLCHHECKIIDGHSGNCGVRSNRKGALYLPCYGVFSGTGIDPIEKKPLYHFKPGSSVYSIGYWGCNFRCPFCQNWQISQKLPVDTRSRHVSPDELAGYLVKTGHTQVCHTYSEPALHIEYILDTVRIIRNYGIDTLLVTNGSLNPEPAEMLYSSVQAANIDLKCMNTDYYRDTLHGSLDSVLANIETAARNCHLEITTLVIPGKNDSVEEIESIAHFIHSLEIRYNKAIPLHLSRYFPQYKENTPQTPLSTLKRLKEAAGKHLDYVYQGNVAGISDTFCPSCGAVAIHRNGYDVALNYTLREDKAACSICNEILPVIPL